MSIIDTNREYWSDSYIEQRRELARAKRKERRFARYAMSTKLQDALPTNDDLPLNSPLSVAKCVTSFLSSGETLPVSTKK